MVQLEFREVFCDGHGIIHQCCCEQLPVFAVLDAFPHGLPNALGDTTMHLSLHNHRIELAATVIDCYKAQDVCLTGIFVYLDGTDMRAEGEDTGLWLEEHSCLQPWFNTRCKRIRKIRSHCHLFKGDGFLWGAGN